MEQLSQTRRDEILDHLAQKVQSWGLLAPAIFFLEANKPYSFLASQLLLFTQPLLGFFVTDVSIREAVSLLEEQQNVERFIVRLEKLARTGTMDE